MLPLQNCEGAAAVLSAAASLAASAALVRTIANDLVPDEVHDYFSSTLHNIFLYFSSQHTIVIQEFEGDEFQGFTINELFEAANIYLGTKMGLAVRKLRAGMDEEEEELTVAMDAEEELVDVFGNVQVKWRQICRQEESFMEDLSEPEWSEKRSYELRFNKKHKGRVLNSYFPYVLERAKAIKEGNKRVKLHTGIMNRSIVLDHPMTFQTLAMDSELKMTLMEDLDNFVNGKAYYKRSAKAWKRGYLLHGPPGTGKSSLIAAMANHLKYDIYDMDLTDLRDNCNLGLSLLEIPSKAILVIEDIDCFIDLQKQEGNGEEAKAEAATEEPNDPWDEDEWMSEVDEAEDQVTVSSFLKLVEGLRSCCNEEYIIVFTTSHREKLDPALLRSGRVDMEIHMSYCTISAFKQLAWNYLGLCDHELFEQIERLIGEVKVTPAEIGGELMKSKDAEVALQGLIKFFHSKIEQDEAKTGKEMEAQKDLKICIN